MPRESRAAGGLRSAVMSQPKPMSPNAVIASAMNMKLPDDTARSAMKAEDWQGTAWNFFDIIPEYRYAVAWVGNNLSKAKLTVMQDGVVTEQKDCLDVLASFFGGPEGQSEMFRQMGIQFTVAGEGWIFGSSKPDEADDWFVAAASEVKWDAASESYNVGDEKFPDATTVRTWKAHPRKRLKSDSPSRACLPILSEIFRLTQHVAAQVDSRLTSAGILLVPNEISVGAPKIEGEDGTTQTNGSNDASDVLAKLMRTAALALQDPESAAARMPIIFQVPADAVDKIKHLTLWSKLDEQAIELRKEAIRRLALGLDMPPEVLEGTADMNHWSSWQMEEAAIKSHTEPLLAVIVQGLSDGVLRPYLRAQGMPEEEVMTYSFGADTTALRLRPNRSKEAFELYDRGLIGPDSLIRETGFDPLDKMKPDELMNWLKVKIAGGSATPDMVMAAVKALGLDLPITPGEAGDTTTRNQSGEIEGTNEARPAPSLKDHPTREVPSGDRATPTPAKDPITAAANVLVFRALERAGNRLKTRMGGRKIDGIGAAEIYRHVKPQVDEIDLLLTDAWLPCEEFGLLDVAAKLDDYTRDLLVTGKPLESETLSRAIWGD